MPGQRRLATSRLRVPNLDGFVITAAGNLLSIGAPRHSRDPEIARSQLTNRQSREGKTWKTIITASSARSPTYILKSFTFLHSSSIYFSKKATFSNGRSHRGHSDRNMILLLFFYHIDKKNYCACPVTGHSQTYILKSITFLYFSGIPSQKKPRFRVAGHTGALRQEQDSVVIFLSY